MVFNRIKRVKQKKYNYLVENFKVDNKVYQVQKYIGIGKKNKSEIKNLKEKYSNWFKKTIIEKKATLSISNYKSDLLSKKQLLKLVTILYIFKEFKKNLHPNEIETIERDFNIGYIHSTTATEGNTCTLAEVTRILDDSISPKGKSLREIYEVRNFEDVLKYRNTYKGKLSKNFILKLHELVMRDIDSFTLGTFRRIEVAIRGSDTTPVPAIFINEEIDKLIGYYNQNKEIIHPVELATYVHVKFEEIHPFTDGNGRVGREIFNLIVTRKGYPQMNFDINKRDEYLDGLEMANKGKFIPILNYVINNYVEQMEIRIRNSPFESNLDI